VPVDMNEPHGVTMSIEDSVVLFAAAQGDTAAFKACREDLLGRVPAPLPFMSYRAWIQWISMQGVQFEEARQ
jgi:hypothetical protein